MEQFQYDQILINHCVAWPQELYDILFQAENFEIYYKMTPSKQVELIRDNSIKSSLPKEDPCFNTADDNVHAFTGIAYRYGFIFFDR